MRWGRIAVILAILMGGCGSEQGTSSAPNGDEAASRAKARVYVLTSQLEEAGLGCKELDVETPDSQGQGDATPGVPYPGPEASAAAFCLLQGAPDFGGEPLASMLLVFDDDAHLSRLPPPEMLMGGGPTPSLALVYGDTWEMYVVPAAKGEAVAEALDGTLQRPATLKDVTSPTAAIHYEVRLRDGGSVPATIEYTLPSGETVTERIRTPWASKSFVFKKGAVMSVTAKTEAEVEESSILCVLASTDEEQGAYVLSSIGDPLTRCATEHKLGRWPPDDSDPIGNPLIRVG